MYVISLYVTFILKMDSQKKLTDIDELADDWQ